MNDAKEVTVSEEEQKDKIEFQRIMDSKAYRRGMLISRITLIVVIAGGLSGLCAVSVLLGILAAAVAAFVGVIFMFTALGNEQTYTVYNTRVVIKKRGDDKRTIVPVANITAVAYKSAFYEKSLLTGTVVITAKTDKGKKKRYKLKHVFDGKPVAEYLSARLS